MHIRVHTNDRPYHCPYKNICHQSFKTKSQLSDHLLKHTQVKKFICEKCGTCFARKSRLKIHLMIHSNLKPFQCEICKKKFREKSNYNFHKKKHYKNLNDKKNQKKNDTDKSFFPKQEKKLDKEKESEQKINIDIPIKEKENCDNNNTKNNNNLMALNDMDFCCFNPENKKSKFIENFQDIFNDRINEEYLSPNQESLKSEERLLKKMNDFNFICQDRNDFLEGNSEADELLLDNNNSILNNRFDDENVINDNFLEEDFYPYPNEL